jgi:small-conductance mechanosensitive channel
LTEDEAAKLKETLHSPNGADPEAGQESHDWDALVKSFGRPRTQTMQERNDNELKRLREEVVQLRAEVRRGAQGTSGTMVSEQTFQELLEPEPEPESEPEPEPARHPWDWQPRRIPIIAKTRYHASQPARPVTP